MPRLRHDEGLARSPHKAQKPIGRGHGAESDYTLRRLPQKTPRLLEGQEVGRCQFEIIGEAGTPGASREWIDAECELAIRHLEKAYGEPPPEAELEVQW